MYYLLCLAFGVGFGSANFLIWFLLKRLVKSYGLGYGYIYINAKNSVEITPLNPKLWKGK